MAIAVSMVFSLALILFGAELFTNSVEWLGSRLRLGSGAVGSLLAAIGTALPETAVPIMAIVFGQTHQAEEVGIGGILGAPFLLVTLGSLIMAIALLTISSHRIATLTSPYVALNVSRSAFTRDMLFFGSAYAVCLLTGLVHHSIVHRLVPLLLIFAYLTFIFLTVRDGQDGQMNTIDIHPLYMYWRRQTAPPSFFIVVQMLASLALILGGAHTLTRGVSSIATVLQMPTFVLSAILIPLATELPETLNSVVWIRQGKDKLAVGNITGAMVFQSTLVPAIGIWLTPWTLTHEAVLTGGLTLFAAVLTLIFYLKTGRLRPWILLLTSTMYWILPLTSLAAVYSRTVVYLGFGLVITLTLYFIKISLRSVRPV